MITEKQLLKIGFIKENNVCNSEYPFRHKDLINTIENDLGYPVDHYVYYSHRWGASYVNHEFTAIGRRCETISELKKFIECIKFIFTINKGDING